MFNKPYPFQKLATSKTFLQNPIEKTNYRFKASQRTYFVTFDVFDFGVAAIKYCDVKDKDSHNAYKKIFNDRDAFRVIGTCLDIMLDYWRTHPQISFAFYAVLREKTEGISNSKILTGKVLQTFLTRYKKVRFNIYREAMLNLFSPQYFRHITDEKSNLYVLINIMQPDYKIVVKKMAIYLLKNFDMLFNSEE